jgi:choline dehydrogenase
MTLNRFDYVIIGAGAAGCVLASRLSEDHDAQVLLVEAGGGYPHKTQSMPLTSLLFISRYAWPHRTIQQAALSHRQIALPMGRVVGGSSAINAMIYTRGNSRSFDRWKEAGNLGWGYREVLPYFKRAEDFQEGPSEFHGVGGPISVGRPRHSAPFSDAFVQAGGECGLSKNPDFNGQVQDGVGHYHVTQRRGKRVSAAAYLARARRRQNLRIVTSAQVTRILLDGRVAVGVEFVAAGKVEQVRAEREVILSAGAFGSPTILMLSGIGPADHLHRVGVVPRMDLPGVGSNLADHLRLPVMYKSSRPPSFEGVQSAQDILPALSAYVRYSLFRSGPLVSNMCEAGGFVRILRRDEPDLQFVTHWREPVDFEPCLVGPRSRGTVRLRTTDPTQPPAIDPRYLTDRNDVTLLVEGIKLSRELARTKAMNDFGLREEVLPGTDLQSVSELERYVMANARTCFHPVGTCKMASSMDREAVVDSELRVHGVESLRVVDASIMPNIVSGNTCAATIMIAERASSLLRAAAGAAT